MDVKDLDSKTVADLKDMAKEMGISGISAMKKADLIEAIAGAGAAAKGAPAAPKPPAGKKPAAPKLKTDKSDVGALKTEKRSLKALIAEAVKAKDPARIRELRRRKAQLRRALKKTRKKAQ